VNTVADSDDGFVSRWSRRKLQVRSGAPVEAQPQVPQVTAVPAIPSPLASQETAAPGATPAKAPSAEAQAAPAPTLDDVAQLGPQSDFTRFVARDVDAGVRNAALKRLFADPRFNVMDGLDVYIDDYGKPDPLPEAALRKLVQARFLGLPGDADDVVAHHPPRDPAAAPAAAEAPAASTPVTEPAAAPAPVVAYPTAAPSPPTDEDPDLQLQPDDAAGRPGAGAGAGAHAGRER
jgi:hypothetical protein